VTATVARELGLLCLIGFTAYGLIGTLRLTRTAGVPLGPRPWALFVVFVVLEAVQVYGLLANPVPRPDADVRAGAVIALAVLCFCGYLQRLYFVSVREGQRTFPRAPFYIGVVILLALVLAAHVAGPYLP
jgi:hypothetical protein